MFGTKEFHRNCGGFFSYGYLSFRDVWYRGTAASIPHEPFHILHFSRELKHALGSHFSFRPEGKRCGPVTAGFDAFDRTGGVDLV